MSRMRFTPRLLERPLQKAARQFSFSLKISPPARIFRPTIKMRLRLPGRPMSRFTPSMPSSSEHLPSAVDRLSWRNCPTCPLPRPRQAARSGQRLQQFPHLKALPGSGDLEPASLRRARCSSKPVEDKPVEDKPEAAPVEGAREGPDPEEALARGVAARPVRPA